jgi:hypothetical protein
MGSAAACGLDHSRQKEAEGSRYALAIAARRVIV